MTQVRCPRNLLTQQGIRHQIARRTAAIPLDRILRAAGFPGSEMIPCGCVLRSLLALKLFGTARHRHVMSAVLDQGLALFAGLNVIPKRSFLTESSTLTSEIWKVGGRLLLPPTFNLSVCT